MTEEQLALFGEARRPPKMAARQRPKVTYAKYRPAVRKLCDACVVAIHQLGQGGAPFPASVRWRRVDQAGAVELLCGPHKDARQAADQ